MKAVKAVLLSVVLTLLMGFTAFAGEWKQDSTGWWYQNDDGSYTSSNWQWIDSNGDGVSECYYFDGNGYCLMNTLTPDGNTVDTSGARIINGIIQTQTATVATNQVSETSDTTVETTSNVWIPATGTKYHSIPNCGRMNPDKAQEIPLSEAIANGYSQCSKCY